MAAERQPHSREGHGSPIGAEAFEDQPKALGDADVVCESPVDLHGYPKIGESKGVSRTDAGGDPAARLHVYPSRKI
jgi:hypothetical protein